MDQQKNTLRPYIEAQLNANVPRETIKRVLVTQGWGEAIVDDVITESIQNRQAGQPTVPTEGESAVQPHINGQPAHLQNQLESIKNEALPENYGVRDAYRDAFNAIKNNALAIGVMTLISLGAIVIGSLLVLMFGITGVAASFVAAGPGSAQSLLSIALTIFLVVAASSLLTGFAQSVIGLAINDGAEKKQSTIKETVLLGMKRTVRVTLANVIFSFLLLIPIIVAVAIGLIISMASPGLSWISILFMLFGLIAMIPLVLRFMLIPVVALFENDVPLSKLFGRTKTLMKGGIVFMAKLLGLAFCVLIALAIILPNEKELANMSFAEALPSNTLSGIVTLFIYASLVMFYRNRKAVKG